MGEVSSASRAAVRGQRTFWDDWLVRVIPVAIHPGRTESMPERPSRRQRSGAGVERRRHQEIVAARYDRALVAVRTRRW